MMNDYISREAAIDAIMGQPTETNYPVWFAGIIEKIKPADVRPAVKGRWETVITGKDSLDPHGLFRRRYYCSACNNWQTYGKTDFCLNCGAEMME